MKLLRIWQHSLYLAASVTWLGSACSPTTDCQVTDHKSAASISACIAGWVDPLAFTLGIPPTHVKMRKVSHQSKHPAGPRGPVGPRAPRAPRAPPTETFQTSRPSIPTDHCVEYPLKVQSNGKWQNKTVTTVPKRHKNNIFSQAISLLDLSMWNLQLFSTRWKDVQEQKLLKS